MVRVFNYDYKKIGKCSKCRKSEHNLCKGGSCSCKCMESTK